MMSTDTEFVSNATVDGRRDKKFRSL